MRWGSRRRSRAGGGAEHRGGFAVKRFPHSPAPLGSHDGPQKESIHLDFPWRGMGVVLLTLGSGPRRRTMEAWECLRKDLAFQGRETPWSIFARSRLKVLQQPLTRSRYARLRGRSVPQKGPP